MRDSTEVLMSIVAGGACAVAVLAIATRDHTFDATTWLAHRARAQEPVDSEPGRNVGAPNQRSAAFVIAAAGGRLAEVLARAGWNESPERVTVFGIAVSSAVAALGVIASSVIPETSAPVLGGLGFVVGAGACLLLLQSAVARRQRRLAEELVPLLELFTLELSGGGNALAAFDSVTGKIQGELASELRRLLIAAQVTGSIPFESRLMQLADRLEIPALASLATILGASREYGTGVVHGVRALATDLRHKQRRELIAHSRRALNHVLIPAAVGVLLPFLAVVMFPAVTALQRNLR
jgi:Flp pilus assembly protein TadB